MLMLVLLVAELRNLRWHCLVAMRALAVDDAMLHAGRDLRVAALGGTDHPCLVTQ